MRTYTYPGYKYFNITEIPFTEIKKIDIAKCKEPTQTLQAYYNDAQTKPDVIMNGGMFVMATGNTIYTLRDENKTLITDYKNKKGFGILGSRELAVGEIDDGQAYRDFISAYPTLIDDGCTCNTSNAASIDYKARRSIVAWDDKNFYLITIDSPGMKFADIQKILLKLGVTYAANLDGGGSTCKLVNGNKVTAQSYNRPVDNVICVYLYNEDETIENQQKNVIYRVQVGAYSVKANADNMLAKVKKLNDDKGYGYENAYVRLIDGLYKVQVGAYSVYANAQRVVEDLKSKGMNAFIATYEI